MLFNAEVTKLVERHDVPFSCVEGSALLSSLLSPLSVVAIFSLLFFPLHRCLLLVLFAFSSPSLSHFHPLSRLPVFADMSVEAVDTVKTDYSDRDKQQLYKLLTRSHKCVGCVRHS